jgi:hypothetical protein
LGIGPPIPNPQSPIPTIFRKFLRKINFNF